MWRSQLVDQRVPGIRSNCGEDLWLGDNAIHRFRTILDRGLSMGSAVRGRLGAQRRGEAARPGGARAWYDGFSAVRLVGCERRIWLAVRRRNK